MSLLKCSIRACQSLLQAPGGSCLTGKKAPSDLSSVSLPHFWAQLSPHLSALSSVSPLHPSVQLDLLAVPPTGQAHSQPSGPRTGCSLCLECTSPDTTLPTLTSLHCLSAQGSLLRKAAPLVLPYSLPLGLILLYLCLFLSTLRHLTYI